eukprot:UN27786
MGPYSVFNKSIKFHNIQLLNYLYYLILFQYAGINQTKT